LAEAVAEAAEDPEAIRRFALRMNHEANRLSNLISELLDLTKVQDSGPLREPDEVSVDGVIHDAIDATRTVAGARNIQVSMAGTEGLTAYGDRGQLVTALSNLVANAVAYSPEGTRVAITTRADENQVEIGVTDQGIGIPEADLDRIFERFYRVDPARSRMTGGTGLGLSIVKHVVANHGGEISVWSIPNEGSTFTMKLPRTADAADLATAAPPVRHASDAKSIEDDPTDPDKPRGSIRLVS
jgi:two-component system sensor histidine kinase SenX3